MENLENNPQLNQSVTDKDEIKTYLLETSRWGKFLSIVGYVGIGLLVIVAIVAMIGLSFVSKLSDTGFPMGIIGFLYLTIAVIYYFPVNYLYKFSTQMREGLESNNDPSVTSAFENLKSLFKFIGIFTIVVLSIYALLLIIVLPITLLIAK